MGDELDFLKGQPFSTPRASQNLGASPPPNFLQRQRWPVWFHSLMIGATVVALVCAFWVGYLALCRESRPAVKEGSRQGAASQKAEKLESMEAPLEIGRKATLAQDIMGTPWITITVKNRASQSIVAFKLRIRCWNKFGELVQPLALGPDFVGIDQERMPPGEERQCRWGLYGQDTARKMRVSVLQVRMADGTEWQPKEGFEGARTFEYE